MKTFPPIFSFTVLKLPRPWACPLHICSLPLQYTAQSTRRFARRVDYGFSHPGPLQGDVANVYDQFKNVPVANARITMLRRFLHTALNVLQSLGGFLDFHRSASLGSGQVHKLQRES
jgi:hypothetical protein